MADKPDKSAIIGGMWIMDAKSGSKYFSGSVDDRTEIFVEQQVHDANGTHLEQYQVMYFRVTKNQKKQAGDKRPEYVLWADMKKTASITPNPQKPADDDVPF